MITRRPYKKTILLSLWCLFLLISCHPDREDVTLVDTYIPSAEIVEAFSGNLQVYISDLDNQPLEGVEVFVYEEKMTSDADGLVQFENIQLDKNGTYVRAIKDNFLFGSDKFFPSEANNYTVIRMLPIENLKSFNSTQAVTIEVNGGGAIDFPSNAFEIEGGGAYNGEVKVFAQRIATNDPLISDIMPGSLLAEDKSGKTQVLGTFGMIAAELFGANNETLQLAAGKEATVHFPLTQELVSEAPESIPLWHFDETAGLWFEEGEANKVEDSYVGKVSHFSFWNCDVPFDLINLDGRVVNDLGEGVAYAQIEITSSAVGVAYGYANIDGYFGGKVPKGELLTIKIFVQGCSDPVYEAEIGGFETNVQLDDIVLGTELQLISGNVSCLGVSEPDSEVIIKSVINSYLVPTDDNGFFSFQIAESLCDPEQTVEVRAKRISDDSASEPQVVMLSEASNLEFEVCADCDFNVNVLTEFSTPCNEVVLNAIVDGGSGSYSYLWSDNSIDSSLAVLENGEYCLTVTDDITECEVIKCTDVDVVTSPISATSTTVDISCFNDGEIILTVSGGTPDYTFAWSGPSGYSSSSQNLFGLFEAGIYTCTITDMNGCTYDLDVSVMESVFTYDLSIITSSNSNVICGDQSLQLEALCNGCTGLPEYLWTLPDGNTIVSDVILAVESGFYTVELLNSSCFGFGEIELLETEFFEPFIEVICDVDGYYVEVSGINPDHSVIAPEINTPDLIESFASLINQTVLVQSEYQDCFETYDIQLPFAEGTPITNISEPTCGSCEDGYIEYDLDLVTGINATIGTPAIYAEGDYENDLIEVNDQQMLPVGVYFFVILSEDGCVIYSEVVDF